MSTEDDQGNLLITKSRLCSWIPYDIYGVSIHKDLTEIT
jgi:hypothetical protein